MNYELTNLAQSTPLSGSMSMQSPMENHSENKEIIFKKRKRKKKNIQTPPENSLIHQIGGTDTSQMINTISRVRKRGGTGVVETDELERNNDSKKIKNTSQTEYQGSHIYNTPQTYINSDMSNIPNIVTSPSVSNTGQLSMMQPAMIYNPPLNSNSPQYQHIISPNSPYAFSPYGTPYQVPHPTTPMTNQQYQLQQQQAIQMQIIQYQQPQHVQLQQQQQQQQPQPPQPRIHHVDLSNQTGRRRQMQPSDALMLNTEVKPPLSPEPLPNISSKKRNRKGKGKDADHSLPDWDDDDGNYLFSEHELLNDRYEIIKYIGHGTFSMVLDCLDHQNNLAHVAVKIVRSFPRYICSAKNEISILKEISQRDDRNGSCIVNMVDSFTHKGHICLVFPKLGCSIYDFISYYHFYGFSLSYVQKIALQLLKSVYFLHNKLQIIHTDIKPENMMLVSGEARYEGMTDKNIVYMPVNTDIKLIDFGSATYYKPDLKCTISTRHYRAPEVILKLVWSFEADMWSVGCILYELYCGKALFQTRQDAQHLAMMEHYLGPIPPTLWKRADSKVIDGLFNKATDTLRWPELAKDEKAIRKVDRLEDMRSVLNAQHYGRHYLLYDLIRKLLKYEARERFTAEQALSHPFFECEF